VSDTAARDTVGAGAVCVCWSFVFFYVALFCFFVSFRLRALTQPVAYCGELRQAIQLAVHMHKYCHSASSKVDYGHACM
jgi:hypothetical protein